MHPGAWTHGEEVGIEYAYEVAVGVVYIKCFTSG